MTNEQLESRIKSALQAVSDIIADPGVITDTSLYAFLYMAADGLSMAITRKYELVEKHGDPK